MRNLFLVSILFLTLFGGANPASAKNLRESLVGKWLGFCSPQAAIGTGRQCSYTFQKNGSGVYQCESYKDLRCAEKDEKSMTSSFRFTLRENPGKAGGRLSVEFQDRPDIRQEKSRAFITGEVLRLQVYEVLRMPEEKENKSEGDGALPYFEFTKVKGS